MCLDLIDLGVQELIVHRDLPDLALKFFDSFVSVIARFGLEPIESAL